MLALLYTFLIAQILFFACTWKLYRMAGFKPWQAAVPFYSTYILTRIVKRPWWWTILVYVPVVGNVMYLVLVVDMMYAFGQRGSGKPFLAVITLGLYLAYFNYTGACKYDDQYQLHREDLDKSTLGAIVFAVVAASLIRAFWLEAYTIPTSSMEGSMMVGDYLFVNKMSYGTRLPMTPMSVPLIHDTIPGVRIKSYLKNPQIPYFRFPALSKIKRNDIVVFNWPADTLGGKPVDKKMNYIKRAVAIAGDTLRIVDGTAWINGEEQTWDRRSEPRRFYQLSSSEPMAPILRQLKIFETSNDYLDPQSFVPGTRNPYLVRGHLSEKDLKNIAPYGIKAAPIILSKDDPDYDIWPEGSGWNVDQYGPIYIPKKGDTLTLSEKTYPLYRELITLYEGNRLERTADGGFLVNGVPTDKYIARQDYYFMMGDNRNNSSDSRYFGFVPFDHVVGKPVFIWLSIDRNLRFPYNIRLNRIFTTVHGEGPRTGYFIHFLIIVAAGSGAWILYSRHRAKKQEKEE